MDASTDCERVAVTLTFLRAIGAKALHISAVPDSALVRFTNTQVRPAPLTLFTVVLLDPVSSDATNARSNSFVVVVEKTGLVIVDFAEFESKLTLVSIATLAAFA